jgi:hypothetical protein
MLFILTAVSHNLCTNSQPSKPVENMVIILLLQGLLHEKH